MFVINVKPFETAIVIPHYDDDDYLEMEFYLFDDLGEIFVEWMNDSVYGGRNQFMLLYAFAQKRSYNDLCLLILNDVEI